jgi:predicted ATPase
MTNQTFLYERLREFTDREEDISTFIGLLQNARRGKLQVMTITGNSGTGKTFLCRYLENICKQHSWQTQALSFADAERVPEFNSIFAVLERLLEPAISPELWRGYQEERSAIYREFYQYQQNITATNVVEARGAATVAGVQQSLYVDTSKEV